MELKITRWSGAGAPAQAQLTDAIKAEGLVAYIENSRAGGRFETHTHPNDEVLVVVSGKMTFGVGDQTWILEAGDRLNLPAETRHWAACDVAVRTLSASCGDKHDPLRAHHTKENRA